MPVSNILIKTSLPGVIILEPKVHSDDRGFFFESFNLRDFSHSLGKNVTFVQDNHSYSLKGVLRGLHYQIKYPQGKLVRVIKGAVFDVAVDIRRSSKNFGKWVGVELSSENKRQLWIPEGFAHGFIVTSDSAEFLYKTTDYRYQEYERSLLWSDPEINIRWPLNTPPIINDKDLSGKKLMESECFD